MTITFQCEHCQKEIKAPDEAAGKRGKCPYCKQSNYVPAPVSDDEILDLAPLDEAEEAKREAEIHRLFEQEKKMLSEMGPTQPEVPLEGREDLKPQDCYHVVVNYCLDMAEGKLDRAKTHMTKLKRLGVPGAMAVADFMSGKAIEPVLARIPTRVLQGYLTQLRDELRT